MRGFTWLQLHLVYFDLHDFFVTAEQLVAHVRFLLVLPGNLLADRLADLALDFVLVDLQLLVVLALVVICVCIVDHVHVLAVFIIVRVEVYPVLLHQVGIFDICFVEIILVCIVVMFGIRVIVRVRVIFVFIKFFIFVNYFIIFVFI